jgi:mxaA protein
MLLALLWLGSSMASEIEIVPQNPRPFGYVVGDTVSRDFVITVKSEYVLDEKTLPKPGRLNAWLELKSVDLGETRILNARQYQMRLTYQLPNSPTEIRVVELPIHKFKFLDHEKSIDAATSEWPITLAPITPDEVLARDGLEAMRPDIRPSGLDTKPIRWRLTAYGSLLASILLYWAYRFFGVPYISKTRRPFTRAYRELNRGKHQELAFSHAVERIHKALNETAGRSLFVENVDGFLAAQHAEENLANMTRQFFQVSRNEFFGSGNADSHRSLAWLLSFCAAWRDVERGFA